MIAEAHSGRLGRGARLSCSTPSGSQALPTPTLLTASCTSRSDSLLSFLAREGWGWEKVLHCFLKGMVGVTFAKGSFHRPWRAEHAKRLPHWGARWAYSWWASQEPRRGGGTTFLPDRPRTIFENWVFLNSIIFFSFFFLFEKEYAENLTNSENHKENNIAHSP